jgi:hypothetical protein
MVGLLALGLVLTRVLGQTKPNVGDDRAVAIARARVDFRPEGTSVRLVRRGIPPRPFWAVSFWIRNASGDGYRRITLVLVDASSGRVTEVRRAR